FNATWEGGAWVLRCVPAALVFFLCSCSFKVRQFRFCSGMSRCGNCCCRKKTVTTKKRINVVTMIPNTSNSTRRRPHRLRLGSKNTGFAIAGSLVSIVCCQPQQVNQSSQARTSLRIGADNTRFEEPFLE